MKICKSHLKYELVYCFAIDVQKDIRKYSSRCSFPYICSGNIPKNHLRLSLHLAWQQTTSNKNSNADAVWSHSELLEIKLLTLCVDRKYEV